MKEVTVKYELVITGPKHVPREAVEDIILGAFTTGKYDIFTDCHVTVATRSVVTREVV